MPIKHVLGRIILIDWFKCWQVVASSKKLNITSFFLWYWIDKFLTHDKLLLLNKKIASYYNHIHKWWKSTNPALTELWWCLLPQPIKNYIRVTVTTELHVQTPSGIRLLFCMTNLFNQQWKGEKITNMHTEFNLTFYDANDQGLGQVLSLSFPQTSPQTWSCQECIR